MIPSLVLIVGAYAGFRCIEMFCKRQDGQYSRAGYGIAIIAALITLIVVAFATLDVMFSGFGSTATTGARFTDAPVRKAASPQEIRDKEQNDRRTEELLKQLREKQ